MESDKEFDYNKALLAIEFGKLMMKLINKDADKLPESERQAFIDSCDHEEYANAVLKNINYQTRLFDKARSSSS
jgi:hypothetical protein